MADEPIFKRISVVFILFVPLLIALSGSYFNPLPGIVFLIILVVGVALLFNFILKLYGKGPVLGYFKRAYDFDQGFTTFFTNILSVLAVSLLGWSTCVWGRGFSAWLFNSLMRGQYSVVPEEADRWASRNVIVWPIAVLVSWYVFTSVRKAMEGGEVQKKPVGLFTRLLGCLLPVGLTCLFVFGNTVSGIFWAIIYASIVSELFIWQGLTHDLPGFFAQLWSGGSRRRSWLSRILVVLILLVIASQVCGLFVNVQVLGLIDNLAGTEFAKLDMVDLNLPLYFFSMLLVIFSLLLFSARTSRKEIAETKKQLEKVILSKRDGTVMYEQGKKSAVRDEVAEILLIGVQQKASDIHLEPSSDGLHIRYRVDGLLTKGTTYAEEAVKPVISSIKVMANMDIAERRRPQDGRFSGFMEGNAVDFRVSSTPMSYGEKIVIRILNQTEGTIDLHALGFGDSQLTEWLNVIKRPHGIVIVCGPTGSGKTTTIYATVSALDVEHLNVVTIEEPIEYKLQGVTQTSINEKADVTFANVLRSTLRQDPDVIFVGEIRDPDTAKIAMQASMTGHMVLTTVHATDVCSCLMRLMDLEINDKNIISFSAILSQRLVRALCPECKELQPITEHERELLAEMKVKRMPAMLYHPVGCPACNDSGYHGRQGIFELLVIKDWIRDLFLKDATPSDIRRELIANGFAPMWHNGVRMAVNGITTLEEVERVAVRE